MPYSVPNGPDVPNLDLAEPDAADYYALGYHRTGVVTGGAVTQPGGPSMTIQVAAADIIIDGQPLSKTLGPVTLDAGGTSPRFDVIGWNVLGGPVAIKGTLSSNPVIPTFDQTTFCMTAVVYIGAGVGSITSPYIVQKQVSPIRNLRRNYAAETDTVLEWITPNYTNSFKALASGTMSWVSSVLSRTADAAMQWATSLTIMQNSPTDRALILKASTNSAKGNNVFEVQGPALATALAAIDATGRLAGANFRTGSGSPEGVVAADRGSIYLNDTLTDGNTALYVKLTDTVATGWTPLGVFVPSAQAIPVGAVVAWPGAIGTDTVPVGYLYCDGSEASSTTYAALSTFCGTKFGTALAGNFKLPDYRGRTLYGVDNVLAFAPGVNIGSATATIDVTQLPSHTHPVSDEVHDHPQAGSYAYIVDQAYRPPYRLPVNDGSGLGMNAEPAGFDHSRMTMMDASPVGDGLPFSIIQPSQSVNFIIKT